MEFKDSKLDLVQRDLLGRSHLIRRGRSSLGAAQFVLDPGLPADDTDQ